MTLLLVGIGGLLGASMRYLAAAWVQNAVAGAGFPYGTLAVNAAGCLLIGLIVGFFEARQPLSSEAQAFAIVGVLGGFTTFSAFGMDTIRLVRDGSYLAGSANVVLQVAIGLSAVAVGLRLGQWIQARV